MMPESGIHPIQSREIYRYPERGVLFKTEDRLIAEVPDDEYDFFEQFHTGAGELLHSRPRAADPGENTRGVPLFRNQRSALVLFFGLARPHCGLY
jgi:hypothetical protein